MDNTQYLKYYNYYINLNLRPPDVQCRVLCLRMSPKGRAMNRLVELRHEVEASFMAVFAWMTDIFNLLNQLNTPLLSFSC